MLLWCNICLIILLHSTFCRTSAELSLCWNADAMFHPDWKVNWELIVFPDSCYKISCFRKLKLFATIWVCTLSVSYLPADPLRQRQYGTITPDLLLSSSTSSILWFQVFIDWSPEWFIGAWSRATILVFCESSCIECTPRFPSLCLHQKCCNCVN